MINLDETNVINPILHDNSIHCKKKILIKKQNVTFIRLFFRRIIIPNI